MELAAAAGAKLFGGLGLGGAAAGAAGAATGGSGILGILQGVATVFSVIGTMNAAAAEAEQAEDMAIQTDLQEGQERVEGAQRQTQLKRELFRVLGENDVAFAAAGIDISSGIAEGARKSAQKRATDELTIDRRDQEFRSALLRARASGYRRQASSARTGGLLSAMGKVANFGIDLAQRG